MTYLDRLKSVAAARTPGRWEQTYGYGDSGNANNVIFGRERPNQYICRDVSGRGNGGEIERQRNAIFIALFGSCADELVAVAEAAEARLHAVRAMRETDLDTPEEVVHGIRDARYAADAAMAVALTALRAKCGEGGA